jgi:hypothetical protein
VSNFGWPNSDSNKNLPGSDCPARKVSLQSGFCAQSQLVFGPKTFVVEIRNGATSSISGKSGFAAVRIEDATTEVGIVAVAIWR